MYTAIVNDARICKKYSIQFCFLVVLFFTKQIIFLTSQTELRGEYGWSKLGYHTNFPLGKEVVKDNVKRVNYKKTSHEDFVRKYERPSIPAVLVGTQEDWKAEYKWNLEVRICGICCAKLR